MASLLSYFRQQAKHQDFELDAAQLKAVDHFQRLYDDIKRLEAADRSFLSKLFSKRPPVQGLYLWGGVGRGKSFLMDAFFAKAPTQRKRRLHFHRFMHDIHLRLKKLKGHEDPLAEAARDIAEQVRLFCFDEFHVNDIADAMILRRLLEVMLDEGVIFVTTSNYEPNLLYLNGLQRSQFLPAIELIKQRFDIVNIDAGVDYRLRQLEKVQIYHYPLDPAAQDNLEHAFLGAASGHSEKNAVLEIEDRPIKTEYLAQGAVWFTFSEICGGPRSQLDYIEISKRFHTVLISDIPQMTAQHASEARRFTWLVDEFYDRRVKLIVSAAVPPEQLYIEGLSSQEFTRTTSRLLEMQTLQYLGLAHLP